MKQNISQFFKKNKREELRNMNDTQIKINNGILWYRDESGKDRFWDAMAFRPCLSSILKENKLYDAHLKMERENLFLGEQIFFPERIISQKTLFINIR